MEKRSLFVAPATSKSSKDYLKGWRHPRFKASLLIESFLKQIKPILNQTERDRETGSTRIRRHKFYLHGSKSKLVIIEHPELIIALRGSIEVVQIDVFLCSLEKFVLDFPK